MEHEISRLQQLVEKGSNYVMESSEDTLRKKSDIKSWSKLEIIGHLIDSAINNLQRFTEISFEQPYPYRKYDQDRLVVSNAYNTADADELISLWRALNKRIEKIMRAQKPESLKLLIITPEGDTFDLQFLMTDYIDHMEHHFKKLFA